jgi:hypothetical protein
MMKTTLFRSLVSLLLLATMVAGQGQRPNANNNNANNNNGSANNESENKGSAETGNLNSCTKQQKCLSFSTKKVTKDLKCGGDSCEFQICAKISLGQGDCPKPKSEGFSNSCVKPDDTCMSKLGFDKARDKEVLKAGSTAQTSLQCQFVKAGGVAEFQFKDGDGCSDPFEAGVESCGPSTTSCTGNLKSCTWNIKAPPNCDGNGGGDPHFKTWGGRYYGYHGECDMVMMQNPTFGNGMGLDLHIRSSVKDFYSLISSAALRIGSDILEIDNEEIYFNDRKVNEGELPSSIAGYVIESAVDLKGKALVEVKLGHHEEEKIVFRKKNGFMWVDIKSPSMQNFRDSTGLLGDYNSMRLKGRDGVTVFKNTTEFAEQWQVNDNDPKLFHTLRAPQYPEKCIMPTVEETKYLRHLRNTISRKEAEKACAHWPVDGQESCIFDVMMTGDIGMADEFF